MCHLERWETVETNNANNFNNKPILNSSYILVAIMTTLCVTTRIEAEDR
jgi:hypothetical protein